MRIPIVSFKVSVMNLTYRLQNQSRKSPQLSVRLGLLK